MTKRKLISGNYQLEVLSLQASLLINRWKPTHPHTHTHIRVDIILSLLNEYLSKMN